MQAGANAGFVCSPVAVNGDAPAPLLDDSEYVEMLELPSGYNPVDPMCGCHKEFIDMFNAGTWVEECPQTGGEAGAVAVAGAEGGSGGGDAEMQPDSNDNTVNTLDADGTDNGNITSGVATTSGAMAGTQATVTVLSFVTMAGLLVA